MKTPLWAITGYTLASAVIYTTIKRYYMGYEGDELIDFYENMFNRYWGIIMLYFSIKLWQWLEIGGKNE